MNHMVAFMVKISISVLLVAAMTAPFIDWSKDSGLKAFVGCVLGMPWLVYSALTLYSDKPRPTKVDSKGAMYLLLPIFFPTEKSRAGCGRSLADSGGKKTGA